MSIQELTAKLAKIREGIAARDKARRDLERVRTRMDDERARLGSLAERLSQESRDVERLEGLSLEGLFYRILGSNQDQLNKERQEELAAKLRHDQCLHGLAALEREFDELNGRMAGFTTLDAQYEAALKEKETLLVGKGTAETRQLLALAEKTGAVQAKQMELAEAILAGEGVKRSLTQVLECLSSASTWGTWDALGGGLTATRLKYSRIDDARRHAHEAQAHAARFERELSDIRLDVDLAFSSFTRFADYFLDNLISDWVIHAKIEKSRSSAQLALTNIEQALLRLRLRVEEGKRELTEAMAERQSIIERA